mgnify:CR=1 FL=1
MVESNMNLCNCSHCQAVREQQNRSKEWQKIKNEPRIIDRVITR